MSAAPRVLVCGSREWRAYLPVREALSRLPKGTVIIHGAAEGADKLAALAAKHLRLEALAFPADWARWGRAAGPIRNQQMLDEGRPTAVWAFHPDVDGSKGTKDMVERARRAGLEVRIFRA